MLCWSKNLFALSSILTFLSFSANSSTIYNNGSPNQADAENISSFIAADDFVLSTSATLTSLKFWSSADVDPFTSQFSGTIGWGIFSNGNNSPGLLLTTGSNSQPTLLDTGVQIDGTEEYQITIALPSIGLMPGSYWLGLHEGAFGAPDDGTEIYWDTTGNQTGSLPVVTSDLSGSSGWYPGLAENNLDLAFELSGNAGLPVPTPEPTFTLPVFFLLAAGYFWFRKESRKSGKSGQYPLPPF